MGMLGKLVASMRSQAARPESDAQYPLEVEEKLNRLHARADVRRHLEILHGDFSVGGERFVDLYFRCLEQTGTPVTPFTVFQRFQTRRDLTRYFLASLDVEGERAECGTYRGATALLLCHAMRTRQADFAGEGFYLIDSFSGTSAPTQHDLIPMREPDGTTRMSHFFTAGKTDITADLVRGYFRDFPQARVCAGWIPEAFRELPDTRWAFVHIDLTLYEPTLAALAYFHARLAAGGAIICTGSAFCPGVQRAVDEFSDAHDAPYVVLGHGERIFLK